MPIYEYRCENGHTFEVMQRMADDPVTVCDSCNATVQRVFHPVAVHFKGSGFYNTDYGTRKRSKEQESGDGAEKADAKPADDKKSGDKATSTTSTSQAGGGSQSSKGTSASTGDKQG